MANIDESLRKPRRAKGTPFYTQRNYFALGVVAIGGAFWYFFELWPEANKLKSSQLKGKFDYPEDLQRRIDHIQLSRKGGSYEHILAAAR